MIEDEITPFGFINTGKEETQFVDSGGQVWDTASTHKSDFLLINLSKLKYKIIITRRIQWLLA
jgi:hypothetical protein